MYKLLMNQTRTYPTVTQTTYDAAAVIKTLQEAGVAEWGEITRPEVVPSGSIFSAPRRLSHNEVWFAVPEDRAAAQNLERALLGACPGVRLVDWHPNALLVWTAAQKLSGSLDVNIEDGAIMVDTRDSGDVGNETPGKEDLRTMEEFIAGMKEALPGIRYDFGTCDEWVYCGFGFSEMGELLKMPAAPKP